ncbi:MAG: AMP-binding protein, partial [Bdellovibrionota bacterium]
MFKSKDLESTSNLLLTNPRWPKDDRFRFQETWIDLVEGKFEAHVGIATSGSTGGSGSLVLLSKNALRASARAVNERLAATSADIWYKSLPNFHVGGLGILVRAHLSGAKVVEDESEKWDATGFHSKLEKSEATLLSLVPTQVFDLVREKLRSPSRLRAVIVGGGRLEESLRLAALDLGWPILPSYGMTEAASQVATAVSPDDPRLVPLTHLEVMTDHEGRLQLSGSSLLSAKITFDAQGRATMFDPK